MSKQIDRVYLSLLLLAAALSACGLSDEGPKPTARPPAVEQQLMNKPSGARIETSVSVGYGHSCAVKSDGSVWCWGSNGSGQLGDGTTIGHASAILVPGAGPALAVAAGGFHTCALKIDGTVRCWGRNDVGQLGDGTLNEQHSPVANPGLSNVVSIGAGYGHSCALLGDGTVRCWGRNDAGMLGDGTTVGKTSPVAVSGLTGAVSIDAGFYHSCARLSDGTARCWGYNGSGQVGDNTTANKLVPTAVSGLSGVSQVAPGHGHTCALLANGTVKCWGYNQYGSLGDGSTVLQKLVPTQVLNLANARQIASSRYSTCATLSNGAVKCWGWNNYGQIGANGGSSSNVPVDMVDLSGVSEVAAGLSNTSCARLPNGTLWCWGDNRGAQLGIGTFDSNAHPTPTQVGNLSGLAQEPIITGGSNFSCGLTAGGTVKCWGSNGSGQLGAGKTYGQLPLSSTPVTVVTTPNGNTPLTGVIDIVTGFNHGCALLVDGTLRCWGLNYSGELGDGDMTPDSQNGPVAVAGLSDVTAVTGGHYFTCALKVTGEVFCWGTNYHGELGQGAGGPPTWTSAPHPTPLKVTLADAAVAIEAGQSHACALLASGPVQCWGRGDDGQFGNGDPNINAYYAWPTPVTVSGLSGVTALSAGDRHTCALLANGTAKCWGSNYSGQLGIGHEPVTTLRMLTPATVVTATGGSTPFTNLAALSVGGDHSCAIRADGQAFCWGFGDYGQLGNGQSGVQVHTNVPVNVLVSGTAANNPVLLDGVATIGAGRYHTCAVLQDGSARCWGGNSTGELGNGAAPWGPGEPHPVTVLQFP